jgi:Ca-activated chloride channel family protein
VIRFLEPQVLWFLLAIPVLALLKGRLGRVAALRLSTSAPAAVVARATRSRAGRLHSSLRHLALASLVVALARPQIGTDRTDVEANGVDIVLAVDVSGSMQSLDFTADGRRVSRLVAAKDVVRKFIEGRSNDRIGLVAFATR